LKTLASISYDFVTVPQMLLHATTKSGFGSPPGIGLFLVTALPMSPRQNEHRTLE